MSNLKTVVDRLKSEKVKERQEGIALLHSTFAREDAVYSIEDGRGWLVLYQALFTTVKIEKLDTVKKAGKAGTAGAAAQRRLTEAAASVRWMVERSVHCLSKKTLTPLLDHLTQMLVHRGQIFTPVALDYIKTIKLLLSWTPHMDHINVDIWVKLVEICFNIILDDSLENELVQTKEEMSLSAPADDSMYQSDPAPSEDDNLPSTSRSTQVRKRRLREHSATPAPGATSYNPSGRRASRHAVSLEQIECASLLALLFRHSTAPFLAEVEKPDPSDPDSYPNKCVLVPIAPPLFLRMKRFLERYPTDTSLHHDYLLALQPFLSQVSLNYKAEVDSLACSTWDALVGLWGTKNKRIKESLVGILRTLFPFLTATRGGPTNGWADGLRKLWTLLNGEAESRWGIDALSIDSLRLQVSVDKANDQEVFVAKTFRAGWNFDATQALAWALLELQADCAEKLFEHTESVHTGTPEESTFKGKRAKREDPISTLLYFIRTTSAVGVRSYHLQVLLFFIDRHWSRLHDALQNDVISTLVQFVSVDEVSIQSWAFLCLAAIARCDGESYSASSSDDASMKDSDRRGFATWDPIWTHAMRRANAPVVCRAACHTAHTLIGYSKHLLTSQRALIEIETLVKDLDLQGPSFPYDAVCMFLAQCLRVASQDVRLYRMQLEEKVLSWLLDNWRVGMAAKDVSGRSHMPPHTISDYLNLLQSVCGYAQHSNPICRMLLPDCEIVDVMEEQRKTKPIRDYVLYAGLPALHQNRNSLADASLPQETPPPTTRIDQELLPPRGRERRVSAFLLKAMESLASEWGAVQENKVHPTAERVRQSLDAAITALFFESFLAMNGTQRNRRVVQSAGKVVMLLAPFLTDAKWTAEERLLILKALEPLVVDGDRNDDDEEWEALIGPGLESGIKSHVLRNVKMHVLHHGHVHIQCRHLQNFLWDNADVQDAFAATAKNLRQLLSSLTGQTTSEEDPSTAEHDGFGPIRTTQATAPQEASMLLLDLKPATRGLVEICVVFLASVPVLQSGEATRDKELIKLVTGCPEEKLLLLGPPLLTVVRKRLLNLNVNVLDNLLVKCADLLRRYSHAINDQFHFLVVDLLKSTSHIWMEAAATSAIGVHVQVLCGWISSMMEATETKKKATFWKIRDLVARFIARYLAEDPSQTFWPTDYHEDEIKRPLDTLLALNLDEDIRVRFRSALLSASLFSLDHEAFVREHENLDMFYQQIRNSLTRDLSRYEHMLTRMLCLGNVMIASSYVRRGPYWHLLEAAFHSPLYSRHIQAVLCGVSERLGLPNSSDLFEAYASQIALSIRQNFLDVLRLPSNLLGYANRRECAEAAFRLFTPANLMVGGESQEAVAHGQRLFNHHCAAVQKTVADGLQVCIGDLVGLQLVSLVDTTQVDVPALTTRLEELFQSKNIDLRPLGGFKQCVRQNTASIAASVIRCLGDQDFSDNGAIVQALRALDLKEAARTFTSLNKYRRLSDFRFHPPNMPRFGTSTILQSLQWCISMATSEHVTAISYHVLHQAFAELHSTPFVNEQIRLLNGIGLLVSVRSADFKDPALLHTFIQKSCSLLAQADLTQAAQSFLEWGFSVYRLGTQVDQRFPDILIRVCALLDDHHAAPNSATKATRGQELTYWIDNQALALCRNAKIKPQVLKALPAWSHQPPLELISVIDDITSENLSATLSDHRTASKKFRLVRRLQVLAEQHAYSRSQFAMTDFWRLKDYIPQKTYLQRDDIDAFASLLVANTGDIYGFGSEHPFPQTLRARHRRNSRRQEETQTDPSPQRAIIQTLLAMLDGTKPSEVNLVYLTLKSLVSAASQETLAFQSWSTEYQAPLEYFQHFPAVLAVRSGRSIGELDLASYPHAEFARWICSLSTLLGDVLSSTDKFYAQLTTLIANNVQFAEEILPVLVHTLLLRELSQGTSSGVSARKQLSDYFTAVLKTEDTTRSCMRAIVDVILHLRNFRPVHSEDWLSHDKWLDVDFRILAKSAVGCGSYTTALLFLELAFEYGQLNKESPDGIEHLLFEIYGHIDEPDGFYGIKTTDLQHFLIKRFHHENQWDKAFRFHGAAIEAGSREPIDADGLLQSFHAFGFDSLAIGTLQGSQRGLDSQTASLTMSYQLGWRTETWDLPDTGDVQDSNCSLYRALRAIYRERDPQVIDATIQCSLVETMDRMRALGNEDITEIREIARNIMCLDQLTKWRRGPVQEHLHRKSADIRLMSQLVDIDPEFEFTDLERILATRASLIRSVRRKEERERIGDMITPFNSSLLELEKRCLVRLSVAARKSNKLQVALNSIVKARRLEGVSTHEVSQEFANVLWLQKEQKLAVQFLKDLLFQQSKALSVGPEPAIERALSMVRLGSWVSEACLEKPLDIKRNYFDAATAIAIDVTKKTSSSENACSSVFHKCALFAEHQYHTILKSPDAVRWKTYVDRKSHEIKQRESQLLRTQAGTHEYLLLTEDQTKAKALLAEDEEAYKRHNGTLVAFLDLAITMYSRCLAASDLFDDDVPIRFCSLWFANFEDRRLQDGLTKAVNRIPSRKFVFLSHQLSARISKPPQGSPSASQQTIQALIIRMCQEHPFHSLYQVYCIRPDRSSLPTSNRRSSARHEAASSLQAQVDRSNAALDIFDKLLSDPIHSARVRAVEQVCDASIQWAKYPIKDNRSFKQVKGLLQIPDNLIIRRLRDVSVPVVTSHPSIDHTLKYDHCVWISHYDPTFIKAGGISVPKISTCYGSNGEKFKQLFKGGNDDLRQDAVMEQVFDLVNVVLQFDRETKKRSLKVRGYTVLPLAAQAGVLEFVGNTVPLQQWLGAAHPRYRPNDLTHNEIISTLKQTRDQYQGKTEAMVTLFKDIYSKTAPVMRHYFTEKHKTPIAWFAMRLNYIRSVATTSIVGHVLGLGDRHVSNILMDNGSGEVVHIDLGIAFDQGKLLRVPERVPFRMTRDMVDGMGYSGTQGVFQRCAEETLRVLRERSDVIMTVLEVFKHDPLHSWTASELKIKKIQDSTNEPGGRTSREGSRFDALDHDPASAPVNEAADRALNAVARKLDKSLSVEYTVNELIAEATDIVNLATIYHGWSPDY